MGERDGEIYKFTRIRVIDIICYIPYTYLYSLLGLCICRNEEFAGRACEIECPAPTTDMIVLTENEQVSGATLVQLIVSEEKDSKEGRIFMKDAGLLSQRDESEDESGAEEEEKRKLFYEWDAVMDLSAYSYDIEDYEVYTSAIMVTVVPRFKTDNQYLTLETRISCPTETENEEVVEVNGDDGGDDGEGDGEDVELIDYIGGQLPEVDTSMTADSTNSRRVYGIHKAISIDALQVRLPMSSYNLLPPSLPLISHLSFPSFLSSLISHPSSLIPHPSSRISHLSSRISHIASLIPSLISIFLSHLSSLICVEEYSLTVSSFPREVFFLTILLLLLLLLRSYFLLQGINTQWTCPSVPLFSPLYFHRTFAAKRNLFLKVTCQSENKEAANGRCDFDLKVNVIPRIQVEAEKEVDVPLRGMSFYSL